MVQAAVLCSPVLVVASPRPGCSLLDSLSILQPRARAGAGLDTEILTDFARFMDRKVPQLLEEFATRKQRRPKSVDVDEIQSLFEQVENIDTKFWYSSSTTEPPTTTEQQEASFHESIESLVQNVVDSMKHVIESVQSQELPVNSVQVIFSGILSGIKETLAEAGVTVPVQPAQQEQDSSVFSSWPLLCKALWYPYHVRYNHKNIIYVHVLKIYYPGGVLPQRAVHGVRACATGGQRGVPGPAGRRHAALPPRHPGRHRLLRRLRARLRCLLGTDGPSHVNR